MEVHGRQPSDPLPAIERFLRSQDLLQEATRDRIRRAREGMAEIEAERRRQVRETRLPDGDVLEIAARESEHKADEARTQRLEELKHARAEGTLDSPERIARAAERILSGEPDSDAG
jgi:hypothetical protein